MSLEPPEKVRDLRVIPHRLADYDQLVAGEPTQPQPQTTKNGGDGDDSER